MNKIWSLPFESLQSNNKWSSYHLTGTVSVHKFHTAPQGRERVGEAEGWMGPLLLWKEDFSGSGGGGGVFWSTKGRRPVRLPL